MLATLPRPVVAKTVSSLLVAPVAVACGFPSPAQDYYDGPIDLTSLLVDDQAATFIVRAAGHSMTGAGISDGDELLVDRSKRPQHGDIIVAILDGELTVKRLELTEAGVVLMARLPVSEVWGIAGRLERRLAGYGVQTI